jgi:hypothetical protein
LNLLNVLKSMQNEFNCITKRTTSRREDYGEKKYHIDSKKIRYNQSYSQCLNKTTNLTYSIIILRYFLKRTFILSYLNNIIKIVRCKSCITRITIFFLRRKLLNFLFHSITIFVPFIYYKLSCKHVWPDLFSSFFLLLKNSKEGKNCV